MAERRRRLVVLRAWPELSSAHATVSSGSGGGLRIRFWGTRGSLAKPGPAAVRYGGNTSCVEAGVTDYMTKPFKPAPVVARVHAWLLRSRQRAG